ncbi:MAG: hypothetical protein ETSY2_32580, partial [Candidatus Entotheonella gemina]
NAPNDLNLNKRSICLNLRRPEAIELVKRLIMHCDVVVENFRPGVMHRLGLGYDTLQAIQPALIMASSAANGATGPERAYPGYAGVFNALSGAGHLTGYTDGPPTEMRISMDLRAGMSLCFAVLAALWERRRSGQGQHIDMSAREAISCLTGHALMHYTLNGESAGRQGNADADGMLAPHGCYRCKGEDRWVTIAVGSDLEWQALCRETGHPEWLRDPRFADAAGRLQHAAILGEALNTWTASQTPEAVTARLQGAGVAAYPTMDSAMLANSEHLRQRGAFVTVQHARLGEQTVLGPPWRAVDGQPERPSPLLGEHTIEILRELLDLSPAEIEALEANGVLT